MLFFPGVKREVLWCLLKNSFFKFYLKNFLFFLIKYYLSVFLEEVKKMFIFDGFEANIAFNLNMVHFGERLSVTKRAKVFSVHGNLLLKFKKFKNFWYKSGFFLTFHSACSNKIKRRNGVFFLKGKPPSLSSGPQGPKCLLFLTNTWPMCGSSKRTLKCSAMLFDSQPGPLCKFTTNLH